MRDRRGDDREPPLRRGPPLRSEREERRFISVSLMSHAQPTASLFLTLLGGAHRGIGYIFSLCLNCLSISKTIKNTFGMIENYSGKRNYLQLFFSILVAIHIYSRRLTFQVCTHHRSVFWMYVVLVFRSSRQTSQKVISGPFLKLIKM